MIDHVSPRVRREIEQLEKNIQTNPELLLSKLVTTFGEGMLIEALKEASNQEH